MSCKLGLILVMIMLCYDNRRMIKIYFEIFLFFGGGGGANSTDK